MADDDIFAHVPDSQATDSAGGDDLFAHIPDAGAASKSPQHTSAGGLAASVGRGAMPIAAGAAAGAALGAPFGGVGAIPGAAAGAAAMGLTELATGAYNPLARHFGWPLAATPQEMSDRILDAVGIQQPSSDVEHVAEAAAGGAANALSGAGAARTVAKLLPGVGPTVKAVATDLAANPGRQAMSGATGGMSAEVARQSGVGPLGQAVAGYVGGAVPYAGSIARGTAALGAAKPSAEAKSAAQAGYVFPPAEIPNLPDRPDFISRLFSGVAGKQKLWQAASVKNQVNTNWNAAEEIGLPKGTHLGEPAFQTAKQAPAAVYREVETAIPEVTLTPAFKSAADSIGGRNSEAEKYFPSMKTDPGIEALRAEMKGGAFSGDNVPTHVAMKYVADLRAKALANFKVVGDAQAHRMGLAQREAADLVEDQIGSSVRRAPAYWGDKLTAGIAEVKDAQQLQAAAANDLRQARYAASLNQGNVAAAVKVNEAQAAFDAADARLKAAHNVMSNDGPDWMRGATSAIGRHAENQTLPDRFQDARKMFAKIFDVEGATNRTTGDVSAAGLARVYNRGRPLTGKLQSIADAYNTAPKSMQVPAQFGHSEDWTALDFFGAMGAMASGHPMVAAGALTRPGVKGMLLSKPYQNVLTGNASRIPPLPLITGPGAWGVLSGATADQPQ